MKHESGSEPDQEVRRNGSTIIANAGIVGVQDGADFLLGAVASLGLRP